MQAGIDALLVREKQVGLYVSPWVCPLGGHPRRLGVKPLKMPASCGPEKATYNQFIIYIVVYVMETIIISTCTYGCVAEAPRIRERTSCALLAYLTQFISRRCGALTSFRGHVIFMMRPSKQGGIPIPSCVCGGFSFSQAPGELAIVSWIITLNPTPWEHRP